MPQPGAAQTPFSLDHLCARPEVGRWQGEASGGCGYCYPCLMRRAALHRLGWGDAKDYRVDVLSETKIMRHRVRGSDLRALFFALKTWEEAPGELEARLWLASPTADLAERRSAALPLLDRGFQEIAAFIREKGGEGWAVFLVNV